MGFEEEDDMGEVWRLVGVDVYDGYMNMAIDEAILRRKSAGLAPNTLRFYRWKPSAVSIGYFQTVEQEVNLNYCRRRNVDVVRRNTGGGAVFHDYDGELTYSLIVNQDERRIPNDILESYRVICGGIVEGLDRLGIKAEFKPINDIVVKGRKISGNAQTRRRRVVLQHGTVLLKVDVRSMFGALKVSGEKISDKVIKSVEERVTSISRELERDVSFDELFEALRYGFEKALGVEFLEAKLDDDELKLAADLREGKYKTEWWNFSRPGDHPSWLKLI